MLSLGTALLKITICDSSLIDLIMDLKRMAVVVVLIPPPVPPGEAPMNINIMHTKIEGSRSLPLSIVLKPAVLKVTD
ncbi:MAG: hypothetical protein BWY32_03381 [bacterium ADurb.Bin243]|nr:MAG: hypothetical protein BWY32_03381 [bacterium ADurb.Bin243]